MFKHNTSQVLVRAVIKTTKNEHVHIFTPSFWQYQKGSIKICLFLQFSFSPYKYLVDLRTLIIHHVATTQKEDHLSQ